MKRVFAVAVLAAVFSQGHVLAQIPHDVYCEEVATRQFLSVDLSNLLEAPLRLSIDVDQVVDPLAFKKMFGTCVDRVNKPSLLARIETLSNENTELKIKLEAAQATLDFVNRFNREQALKADAKALSEPVVIVVPQSPPVQTAPPRSLHCTTRTFGNTIQTDCF